MEENKKLKKLGKKDSKLRPVARWLYFKTYFLENEKHRNEITLINNFDEFKV